MWQDCCIYKCPALLRDVELASLDLRSLSRADGPPSELQARREKYAFFEKQCSEVAEGILVASDVVARNRETLKNAGVTHVINCVGFLYPPYFKNELQYLVLYLQGRLSHQVCLNSPPMMCSDMQEHIEHVWCLPDIHVCAACRCSFRGYCFCHL